MTSANPPDPNGEREEDTAVKGPEPRHTADTITDDDLDELYTRADQANDLLRIAHETSNRSEAERALAVQRAERAEAAIERVQHACHALPYEHARRILAALDETSPAATQATQPRNTIAAHAEVRTPCPHCPPPAMIPRTALAEHLRLVHAITPTTTPE